MENLFLFKTTVRFLFSLYVLQHSSKIDRRPWVSQRLPIYKLTAILFIDFFAKGEDNLKCVTRLTLPFLKLKLLNICSLSSRTGINKHQKKRSTCKSAMPNVFPTKNEETCSCSVPGSTASFQQTWKTEQMEMCCPCHDLSQWTTLNKLPQDRSEFKQSTVWVQQDSRVVVYDERHFMGNIEVFIVL